MEKFLARLPLSRTVVRYIIVGTTSLAVDYVILLILFRGLDISLGIASTVSFLCGLIVNFILNKYWAFDVAARGTKQGIRQAVLYGILVILNIGFTDAVLIGLHHINIAPEIGKLFTTALITLWNYVLYQKVIFKTQRPTDLERSIM